MKIDSSAVLRYDWYLDGDRIYGVAFGDPEDGWLETYGGVRKTGTVEAVDRASGKVYRTIKQPHPPARKR
jgi:hypothetical protein